ncbi:MAG TPA: helix-turn-helix transcriptional regulator [Acetobacteraceae bacterium]|nr:helix-turn-helix transcriptional regulator [Acetobacteraceae bacterium]
MTDRPASGPVIIAVDIGEAGLADRLAALLAGVPGLRLATAGEAADAVLVAPGRAPPADADTGLTPIDLTPIDLTPIGLTPNGLTPREREVLALLAEGASNKLIARRLGISTHTAKFHVGSLLDKLDATGRTDAVAQAARIGVIHL